MRANVFTRFNAILGTMLALILVFGSPADGLFGIVLVVNALIGIVQEYRAKRTLDRLAVLSAPIARVVRDGASVEIPLEQVVLDDLLELRAGDQVPADGTVRTSDGLELDESLLTGESDPVLKRGGRRDAVGRDRRGGERPVPGDRRRGGCVRPRSSRRRRAGSR